MVNRCSPDWVVLRDGCLRCDEEGLRSLSYHPALNAILAVTSRGSIKVIDGTSGAILQASALHAKPGGRVRCQYFPAVDKVLFVDDYAVGCRKDLNGILLLDTALQAPVSKPEDMVQLELPVTEAQQMLYACMEKVDVSNTEGYDLFLTQLKEGLENTSHETAANHKVAKWATVTFHLPHHVLKVVTSAIVNELKKLNQNVAALSVASSVMDRLSYLLPSGRPELGVGPGRSVDRSLMYSEANRRETFTSWPHTGYRWAQPDPMAQAGFYHQPASTGDDRAMCFTCSVCLVCWEPTDEPWSEHERHSPNCPFVKGEHTQNVPLSVTLATSPAQFPSADGSDKIVCYGFGSCPHFLATATKRGKICIWDVSKLMKVHLKFEVNPYDPAILRQLILSGSEQQSLTGTESRRPTLSWLEEATCCSDLPKLEGDSDDQIEDSDSEEHSRSESVTGPLGQKETMEVSLGVTALSVLQQPEKLQWEVVASVLEDTVKDLEELGANTLHSLGPPKSDKAKERLAEHHNIPFPCLLAGGLLSYRSAASSPLGPPPSRRSMDSPVRTAASAGLAPDQGPMEIESCNPPTDLGSPNLPPAAPVQRTMPVLLLYSIKEADEKSSGKVFTQMNNLMSKGLHEEGFTVPQIIEMEFDSHEQLLLQDPPITYIQQFADAAAGLGPLDGEKWSSLAPRPGSLVQCLRLPKALEEENLYVDSITPCSDGLHLLVGLQPCSVESLSAINQVEVLNTLNRLHSALCGHRKGQTLANGHDAHSGTSPPQTPLILPPHTSRPLGGSGGGGGYLALYKLNYTTRIVTLEEEPVKVQQIRDPRDAVTSLLLLPPDVLDGREDDGEETSEDIGTAVGKEKRGEVAGLGHLVVTTQAGYIMILDLSTLEVMAKVEPPKKEGTEEVDPFVSVTYCSGTDRLCACTKGGELHFLQIGGVCDDIDDADIFVDGPLSNRAEQLLDGAKPTSNPSSPGITGVDLLVDQPLNVETLSSLVELTRFETLTPRFSATVPPCWVEVQQEQQQRRHPQHLHQQHHGDAAQHTRTWKLQSDSSSWDEHVFELVLPKACMVGHVDFKFVLNSSITNIPQIQVTLLKNKAPGLCKVNETAVDRQLVFPLSHVLHSNGEKNGQPHLLDFSEDIQFMDIEESPGSRLCPFLHEHKDDILCGPVWLSSGLDLSGHAGMLSLTSPKLLKGMAGGKYRSFLAHIKAVNDKGLDESLRPVVRMPSAKPHSSKAHSLSSLLQRAQATKEKASTSKADPQSAPKKPDNLRGCDLLQEVSVTIRRFKKTSVPKERVQRCAMLQFPELHEKLLRGLCKHGEDGQSSEHCQSLILDILCWLAGVYSNGPCSLREGKEGLLTKTRRRLTEIIRACFFEAGRSIAHKCSRFLALCISTGKGDPGQQGFGQALFKALLDNMPYLPAAATGGSVFWYFVLLNYVKDEDLASCSTACASLLTAVSRQLQDRLTPLEALLQTRYGLYGSPFDPVLFDLEVSGSSCKNAFSSSIGVQSDEIDLSDILSGNGKVNSSGAAEGSFTALTGLLEVEPLHFTCVSTSDGTRVERDDASMFTVSTFGVTPTVTGLSAGTVGEASTALSSAAQVALQSLSHAMVSAEQQLQVLQEKQQQLLKLQQQKAKLEAKLHQTTSAATAASGVVNSVPSNPSSAPGFFIHPSDVIPPTPKTTPLFMTPPLTPPNEAVSAAISVELAQLFPGSVIEPPPVNLSAQNKNTQKNPIGSGLALAISQASHFLQPPPNQSIIIERMHSGARRFVTLDFGRPVLLTDALIPTCADLASLSIDIWTLGEEVDGRRLVVATDISTHSLILHDLLPPPVCRFMKITVIGRYGSTNARAKIPLGFYYGHTYILPWESELKLMHDPLRGESEAASQPDLDQHLSMMVALQEDIQCRYNLACHRLETLLQNIDLPPLNSANNAQYFLRKPDKAVEEDSRVFSAYQDCIQLQLQLNLAHHAVQRLRVSLGATRKHLPESYNPRELVQNSSTEQLRTIIRYLLDTLLSLLHCCNGHSVPSVLQNTFHSQACEELFKQLCISGTPKIRLHAGLLLVQLCGGERWWGQFLSNVLQELYNSEQLLIFPQDRVFMLLSCIGQRSLSNSGVLEGLLNLLDTLLSPLQPTSAAQTRRTEGVLDIPMISWAVMLVSRLLDYVASVEDEATAAKKPLGAKDRERSFTGNQWSFINNSLQSQNPSRSAKGNNSSLDRLYSRKIRKQLVHHKQQLNLLKAKQKALVEQIEKEKIQSNKGSSYKLLVEQAKLKQATSKHFKDLIRLRRTAEWPRSTLDSEASVAKETPEVELLPFTLSHERCICVVQKLALFLLSMDFTCHADLLLFVCKVLARIANATRPTIHLCEVVSEQQLERLLLLLVGTDFNRGDISWGGAWAQYSLTCMLQDILAGELLSPVCVDGMEGAGADEAGAASSSVVVDSDDSLPQPTPIPLVETIDEPLGPDIIAGAPPLSSLEKDKDIDFDLLQDLMDVDIDPLDIDLEKDPLAAKVFKPISSTWYDYWGADYGSYSYNPYTGGMGIPVSKPPAAATTEKPGSQNLSVSVSQALDARLEVGLEQQAELMLKMMATLEADAILQALTSTSPSVAQSANGTDDTLLRGGFHSSPPSSSLMVQPSSIPMLSTCFNKLFSLLQVHHVQLESLLQLWLTLSLSSCSGGSEESGSDIFLFNASRVPTIPLNQASISSFLSVLAWYSNTSLRTWCLVLHSLTLMTNMPASASSSGMGVQESTAQQMVSDPTLVHVFVRFLSGGNPHGTSQHSSQVGPTATQALQEFLTRLQVHLSSTCPQMFSEFLLKLLHILSTERGPFQSGQGPLDAQVKLLEFTLEQNFEVVSVTTILAVIESITFLVHHYITCSDKVISRSGSDSSVGARACFGGLFANIIRPGDAKAVCGETTRDQLMFDLLKLVNALVMLPLSGDREFSGRLPPAGGATDSVSDEEKVCGSKECGAAGTAQHQGPAAGVADLVLANQQIMSQILSALGQCNSSAMAMIIGASGLHLTKHENFHGGLDAISVGDGLFTILTTLSKRATSVQVMLQPILTYMACGYMGRQGSLSTCQLSEPLLWFILRVLDTSEALKAFHDMGGVQLICNNMVTSTRAIVNTARSMVSTIMKFLDSGPGKAADGSLKARVLTSEPDNAEGLHNFAPLGTITSSSPTAQPAEVLLQATPPHRRARSAAWSYIFLPEEAWCDLTIHLPAAVLLKEIHIQPHLASLATCPSSVSVEISADGVNMLPLSTPVITSGLTFIKFQLVKAEVASAVCLRLHRPRDASTLGLSQIKLLGLTAFGNTSSATVNNPFLPSEDQVSKTSIGWLRLLHHCLTHVSDLEAMMASAAAPTANLLQTCAALLMSPYCGMHSPNIEAVLVKIGLQSTRIGLKLIDILLRNCAASGTDLANLNSPLLFGRLNGLSSDSTIDILYQLGTTQDPGTKDRIQALLQWVYDSSRVAALKQSSPLSYVGPSAPPSREYGLLMPSPSHLHCVASVLWHSYELPVDYDLPGLLNRELFDDMYFSLFVKVLCELFQSAPQRGNVPVSGNISGFIRRLFLQLMLEDEKVTVFLQSPCPLYKGRINATSHVIQHPMYGAGHKFRKLHLPISTTLSEVLDRVSDTPSITAKLINEQKEDKEKKNHEEKEKMKADNGFQDNYSVVVASGLKSQSKRALSTPPRPPSRRGRVLSDKLAASSGVDPSAKTISVPVFHLCHKLLPGQPLPPEMTLAQLLTLLYERKLPQGYRSIDLTVKLGSKVISDPGLSKTDSFKRLRTEKDHCEMLSGCPDDEPMTPGDEGLDAAVDDTLLETSPIQSPLQVFAGMGGLALIAERLPMLYPDVIQQVSAPVVPSTTQEKPKDSDQFEWVTIEQSGELVYEAPETIAAEPPPIKSSVQTMSPIPAHSLAAFGLFLRLPGYAEVLLKERKHAQCLLRLVLGVTDDGEGSHILQSPSANVLPTLPFHVLRSLFSSTPLTTDDGLLLRRMALEIGAIHLILACLSALSHHAPRVPSGSANSSEPQVSSGHVGGTTEEQQLYWAKGTGFGTGSTASGWDVEQALTKQRLEEEHVTCLLQVLASYINPSGCVGSGETLSGEVRGHSSSLLPSVLQELLSQSCLIPAMSSYLRNDSVLDMARHVPLYRALLELLRAISTCTSLVPLLLPLSGDAAEEEEDEERTECQTSVGMLLAKMKTCVDTYTNRLRCTLNIEFRSRPRLFVPEMTHTREIVKMHVSASRKMAESSKKATARPKPLSILRSVEEKYTAAMKKLQFDTFEMVCEDEDSKLVFKVNYHYLSQVKNASDANSAARARRLAQEAVTLSTSLPLSSSSSVFVRCDEERLDIMKVLITGPADTPYANGCFEFDVYFPQDYPNSPPLVNLETTGGHSVRFNPNLYNDGKVCLSILNTWHGRPEEKWNPHTSSFLQVLVSIQSLILVAEPYFNEPGYERSRGTPSGTQSSREYDGNIRQATVKWAMLEQIRNPSPCFKEVIHRHFYLKRAEIMSQCEGWICDIQQYSSDKRVGRTMSHHAAALKRHTAQLREELLKLPCPEGLEPDGEEFSEKSTSLMVKELPSQDAEKQADSPDAHCSDGQL
uniref:Dual E2 ubiquitin-conjugating enzyme/E3 ubiquitin-protein ligase BIRC6 n=1 Tax=Sinocyclocheilus rhinocerous TaxID=307959 RepID=A0A673KNA8_9TELE